MKNNQTVIEGFKAVDFMRETRDKISKEIATMSFEEIKKYLQIRRDKLSKKSTKINKYNSSTNR